jgi:hypothetical protein
MYSENVKNMPYHITISFMDSLWVLIQFFHILGCRTLYIFFSFVYWVPDLIGSEVKLLLFVGDKDTILLAIHTDSIDRCKTNYPRSRTGSAPSMRSIQYQRKNINVLRSNCCYLLWKCYFML